VILKNNNLLAVEIYSKNLVIDEIKMKGGSCGNKFDLSV
jgi:hypothetical protein